MSIVSDVDQLGACRRIVNSTEGRLRLAQRERPSPCGGMAACRSMMRIC
jgi:hypothetical protein